MCHSQCCNMAVLARRTRMPESGDQVPDLPTVTVLKDISASPDQVIPAPTCWVGGRQVNTQGARADVVYMIAQIVGHHRRVGHR